MCDQSSIFPDCSFILCLDEQEEKDDDQNCKKQHEYSLYALLPAYFAQSDHNLDNKITIKAYDRGILPCKKGTIDYFIYSLGETLNISLKQVEKYFGLLNPTEYATSEML